MCLQREEKALSAARCVNAKIKLYLPVSPYELSEILKVKKLTKMEKLTRNAHRPALITDFAIDLIIKARREKLPFSVISQFLGINTRTLYRWIEQGKDLHFGIEFFQDVDRDKLSPDDHRRLRLYESLNPTYSKERLIELRQNAHYELDKLIDQWKAQKQEREDARNNRAMRKKHRTAKQREMDRKRKQRERELQKSIERLITARHSG